MAIIEIPFLAQMKDEFLYPGSSPYTTKAGFDEQVRKLSQDVLQYQISQFESQAATIDRHIEQGKLPEPVETELSQAKAAAQELADAIKELKEQARGFFVEYSTAIANGAGFLPDVQPDSIPPDQMVVLTELYGITPDNYAQARAEYAAWNESANQWNLAASKVIDAANNYSDAAYVAYQSAALAGAGAIAGALFRYARGASWVQIGVGAGGSVAGWLTGLPLSVGSLGFAVLSEAASEIGQSLEDTDKKMLALLQQETEIRFFKLSEEAASNYFAGFIADILHITANSDVPNIRLDIADVTSDQVVNNVQYIGSSQTDEIRIVQNELHLINVYTLDGEDRVTVDRDISGPVLPRTVLIETGADNDVIEASGIQLTVRAGDGDDKISVTKTVNLDADGGIGDDKYILDYQVEGEINDSGGNDTLGSGLIDQSQKMTEAAMQMAEKKVWAHLS